jgi:transcriptional regulator GlxA family with amidase domain
LTDPRVDLTSVGRDVGVGERQLRRRFLDAVGYGPKTLQRVLRFRSFLDDLPLDGDLADAAARAGYADQPHLNRECRDLAGLTPAELAAAWA